jgi:NADPH:quinone reductase-like Zn-dependent oxidoreductase
VARRYRPTTAAQVLSLFVSQKLSTFVSSGNTADLVALRELIEAGQIKPAVDRTYHLSEVATAIRDLMDGGARGKIVITVLDGV